MRKLSILLVSIISIIVVFSNEAVSKGVIGGNTIIFRPINDKGNMITVKLQAKHPYEDEIIELIKKATLPRILKREMINDIRRTAVRVSTETIKYSDIIEQLGKTYVEGKDPKSSKTVKKKIKITHEDENTVTKEVIEHHEVTKEEQDSGVYIVPIKVENPEETYVAAYTQRRPRSVIYFTQFLDKMTKEEVMAVILHEQAHRLRYLKDYWNDERFVMAWTETTLDYFNGQIKPSEYFDLLRKNKLSVNSKVKFDEETYDPETGSFKAKIYLDVRPENIIFSGLEKKEYVLQLNNSAFENYPQLQDMGDITVRISYDPSGADHHYLEDVFAEQARSQYVIPMEFELNYKKKVQKDSTGMKYQIITFESKPSFEASLQVEKLQKDVKALLSKHSKFSGPFVGKVDRAFLAHNRAVSILAFYERFSGYLDRLKESDEKLYSQLNGVLKVNFTPGLPSTFSRDVSGNIILSFSEDEADLEKIDEDDFEKALQLQIHHAPIRLERGKRVFIDEINKPKNSVFDFHDVVVELRGERKLDFYHSIILRENFIDYLKTLQKLFTAEMTRLQKEDPNSYRKMKSLYRSLEVNFKSSSYELKDTLTHRSYVKFEPYYTSSNLNGPSGKLIFYPVYLDYATKEYRFLPLTESFVKEIMKVTLENERRYKANLYIEALNQKFPKGAIKFSSSASHDQNVVEYQRADVRFFKMFYRSKSINRLLRCVGRAVRKTWPEAGEKYNSSRWNHDAVKTLNIVLQTTSSNYGNRHIDWSWEGDRDENLLTVKIQVFRKALLEQWGVVNDFVRSKVFDPETQEYQSYSSSSGEATWQPSKKRFTNVSNAKVRDASISLTIDRLFKECHKKYGPKVKKKK